MAGYPRAARTPLCATPSGYLVPRAAGHAAGPPVTIGRPAGLEGKAGLGAAQSNEGLRSRVRFSSKKPSASVTSASPSNSRPAASPLGAGVMTGPKIVLPRRRMTGVPTSSPTASKASWWEALICSSNSVVAAA